MKRSIRRYSIVLVFAVMLVFAPGLQAVTAYAADAPAPVKGTLYEKFERYVTYDWIMITRVVEGGGSSSAVQGIPLTKKDLKEWKQAEKRLRSGKFGKKYAYQFSRKFYNEIELLGFLDTVVGSKYRYLELRDCARTSYSPYFAYLRATKRNKKSLDDYAKKKGSMQKKLDALYKKEIGPYESAGKAFRIALAVNVVDNYFTYKESGKSNNLVYTVETKKGVCADYSYMLDYLLRKMGIATRLVSVKNSRDYHMINALKISGQWFYMDPTNMDVGKVAFVGNDNVMCFAGLIGGLTSMKNGWQLRSAY